MPVVQAFPSHLNRSSEDKTTMRKSTVCRCLFGKPDHESLREDLKKELESDRLRGLKSWNFDFKKSEPIEGRYKWDVIPSDYVPEFYSRPIRPSKVRVQRTDRISRSFGSSSSSDDEALAVPISTKHTDVLETVSASQDYKSSINSLSSSATAPQSSSENSTQGPLVQSHIDDFMRRRKRRSPSADENVQTKSPRTEKCYMKIRKSYFGNGKAEIWMMFGIPS
ncbi:hypothetical protein ScPMuIL_013309 [Solemya velum]